MENNTEKILNKLLICAYVIIALLFINTIILFTSNIEVTKSSSDENNTAVEEENTEYDVSMFNSVTTEEALKLFDSSDIQVIYIGRSTCGYCVKFLPSLQKAQKEYGYKTNYLDITTITEDDQAKLIERDNDSKFIETNIIPGYTPQVILVKDGKLVDGWVGYAEYDEFAKFLEKNGITK